MNVIPAISRRVISYRINSDQLTITIDKIFKESKFMTRKRKKIMTEMQV